jgi:hypothetical protein
LPSLPFPELAGNPKPNYRYSSAAEEESSALAEMEAALEAARSKDTKERLAGVERLHEALEAAARRGLTAAEVTSLVDTCMDLTKDANFRVAQGGLHALSAAAVLAGEHFKMHLNALVPAAVERLGDGKQPVRDASRQLLVTLMEVSRPLAYYSLSPVLCSLSWVLQGNVGSMLGGRGEV